MDSKTHKAVCDTVMDRAWLKTLVFYVKFRHTSKLENVNSMMLKYASKRIAFSYDVFITRIFLAANWITMFIYSKLIWKTPINGQVRYKKTFSKRSKNWRVEPVKERKKYPHWAVMAAKILEKRACDTETIVRHKTVQPNHPKRLAATIAMKEAPSTAELAQARLSRFSKRCIKNCLK
ncbi:PREDICTED: uncharacterized protein LOC107339731 [Acropora digitifera]|uniref:uncharacterized protein LOC107339731 n=1 Tax=Acropora digitifera TaxID=70779 RepID=UPI00077A2F2A|nr:PREDICTED: uncharacterized protein LOC107339731 [Acropora digitifera]